MRGHEDHTELLAVCIHKPSKGQSTGERSHTSDLKSEHYAGSIIMCLQNPWQVLTTHNGTHKKKTKQRAHIQQVHEQFIKQILNHKYVPYLSILTTIKQEALLRGLGLSTKPLTLPRSCGKSFAPYWQSPMTHSLRLTPKCFKQEHYLITTCSC